MFVESGATKSGRQWEIREGTTGNGNRMFSIQWEDGQITIGSDSKPLSLAECRLLICYTV